MSYPKIKVEQYANIGGINRKASVYVTGEKEVLSLINLDLSIPGALKRRPGLTNAISGQTIALGASIRLSFGTQFISDPFTNQYSNYVIGTTSTYTYSIVNFRLQQNTAINYGTTTGADFFGLGGSTTGQGNAVSIVSNQRSISYWSADGYVFKAPGYYFGLPYNEKTWTTTQLTPGSPGNFSGTYTFAVGYEDVYGYRGPIGLTATVSGLSTPLYLYMASLNAGNSYQSGAVYFVIYSNRVTGYPTDSLISVARVPIYSTDVTLSVGVNSSTSSNITEANNTNPNLAGGGFVPTPESYSAWGSAVEYWNNRLWVLEAANTNKLKYSNIIETQDDAQAFEPEAFEYLRNDSYQGVGIKAYNQSLMGFLQKGVFRITGDAPFNVQNINNEYGLISSRAIVVFNQRLWFLDSKAIIEFDGSSCREVSNRVQLFLDLLNLETAVNTATAYHYESRNEVWFAIPIGEGVDQNNIILVYNYDIDGWTTFRSAKQFTMLQEFQDINFQTFNSSPYYYNKRLFIAGVGGSMQYFGESFSTDDGSAITCLLTTRNHAEQGHSSTNIWRRLYLDTGPWAGVTMPIQCRFFSDFSTATISATATIYASGTNYSGKQQTRIDMGVVGKAFRAQMEYSGTQPIIIYGYSVESRHLRNV